jgi:hypothetical protein
MIARMVMIALWARILAWKLSWTIMAMDSAIWMRVYSRDSSYDCGT